ncbi:hypothetical protein M2272_001220 [Mycobacterium frederiksbergense]|uniref:Uncharacterized protein n=1 Tax=Mycolicibacterium frederiksbergense TaxID=117567 RepID=A0ABT6KV47_9MYCO|nr:hypothetical protein [Mycolicibacterium frederiksbergense]
MKALVPKRPSRPLVRHPSGSVYRPPTHDYSVAPVFFLIRGDSCTISGTTVGFS